jgi:hypothetical protein
LLLNGLTAAAFQLGTMSAGSSSEFGSSTSGLPTTSFILNYAGTILFSAIASLLIYSVIYALIKSYYEREDGLNGITFNDIRQQMFHNMKRVFILGLFLGCAIFMLLCIIIALGTIIPISLVLTLPFLLAILIPLALVAPIYLLEKVTLSDSIFKTYRLGFTTWGGIFLILLVMGLIAGVLQGICALPWYVVSITKTLFAYHDDAAANPPIWMSFLQYIFSILMLFASYLSTIFVIIGLVYQYGHASELVEGITIVDDIDNFDKL